MSNADIFNSNGKIDPFFLPAGASTTPTLAAVLTAGNSTGGTTIESSTGQMNLNTLNVVQIAPLDVLITPAVGILGDISLPDAATITYEGDGNIVAQGALTISKGVGGALKIENVNNAPSAIPNVLAYDETTGEVFYQPAGTSSTAVNSVNNSDGSITVAPTTGNVYVSLPAVGTANTYAYPASITTDAKGRVTAVTAGALPNLATVLTTGPDAGNAGGNNITNVGSLAPGSLSATGTSITLNNSIAGTGTQIIQGLATLSAQEVHINNTDGGSDAIININNNVLEITTDTANLILTKDLEINGQPGQAFQVLTSQGTNLPPVWADIPVQPTETLAQVLAAGNSAGANSINMNSNNINNVTKISNGTSNMILGTNNNIVVNSDGTTKLNGNVDMGIHNIINVLKIANGSTNTLTLGNSNSLVIQLNGDVTCTKNITMIGTNITNASVIQGHALEIDGIYSNSNVPIILYNDINVPNSGSLSFGTAAPGNGTISASQTLYLNGTDSVVVSGGGQSATIDANGVSVTNLNLNNTDITGVAEVVGAPGNGMNILADGGINITSSNGEVSVNADGYISFTSGATIGLFNSTGIILPVFGGTGPGNSGDVITSAGPGQPAKWAPIIAGSAGPTSGITPLLTRSGDGLVIEGSLSVNNYSGVLF